jgi:diguanylate cyclase (GGDEF)-like protein
VLISHPLPPLDLFTMKVMTVVTTLVVSFVTLLAWRINRRVAGMALFALGLLATSSGALMGIARIIIPGNAILIACNVFMLGGMIAVVQGIRVFRGFPPLRRAAIAAFAAVVSVFYFYWMFVHDSFGMRVGVISPAFALLSVDAAVSMFRRVPARARLIYWPTGFAFAFAGVYLAVRTVGALSGSFSVSIFSPVPIEMGSTICANVAYIGCAFGMLLASNTQLRNEAEQLALFDPLTNLPNRRLFLDRLLDAERSALATGRQFGLIYLDLDGFKSVNDTMGHHVGDDLLRNVSAALTRMLGSADLLARIGGDEFVVLVQCVESRGEVATLAERLRSAVESKPLPGDYTAWIRISCGVAIFPEDGHSAHDVMRKADAAMYKAKLRSRMAGQLVAF